MIKIIDTYNEISNLFEKGVFSLKRWRKYVNSFYDGCEIIFISDMEECISTGRFTFENDFLPVLNAVNNNGRLEKLHKSFLIVIDGLNDIVIEKFGREIDCEIVLYVGLCNGAGWVTQINGKEVILLGIEKILELDWCDVKDMHGLIFHELGHTYHSQYGNIEQKCENSREVFLWQLFVEGIAMYFEQILVGNKEYFHQDKDGWKEWCDEHFRDILNDFNKDLDVMTQKNQRYFGDWCSYNGKCDVGYYLGSRFVNFILSRDITFDEALNVNIQYVCNAWSEFIVKNGK